jgi:hypothetical protein
VEPSNLSQRADLSGSRPLSPSEREEFERVKLERDQLLVTVRELAHSQLISRDQEIGLRGEVAQARIDLMHAHAAGNEAVNEVRRSATWRVGAIVLRPIQFVRRLRRRGA